MLERDVCLAEISVLEMTKLQRDVSIKRCLYYRVMSVLEKFDCAKEIVLQRCLY